MLMNPSPFEYRIPGEVLRYYKLRYGRDIQVGDIIPGPGGRSLRVTAIRQPAQTNT